MVARHNGAVPKIAAPTVAENRELRRSALITAAIALMTEQNTARISMADIATTVGLSRSAVYEYYSSSADLIADVLIEELTHWGKELHVAVDECVTPKEAIAAWIRTSVSYAANGRHALVRAAGQIELPSQRKTAVTELHLRLVAPLEGAITSGGGQLSAVAYIWGVTQAAIDRIEAGSDPQTETAAAIAFCTNPWSCGT